MQNLHRSRLLGRTARSGLRLGPFCIGKIAPDDGCHQRPQIAGTLLPKNLAEAGLRSRPELGCGA
jgi:hypothetical protein